MMKKMIMMVAMLAFGLTTVSATSQCDMQQPQRKEVVDRKPVSERKPMDQRKPKDQRKPANKNKQLVKADTVKTKQLKK